MFKFIMEILNYSNKINNGKPFDILPDEMIIHLLSFVDVDTLLNCRLVCRKFHVLIDASVFQEKASRQNEHVNDGHGFYSFSQIDSNTVRKLELPWYVFYVICRYDPFNRNLVKNHCGQHGFKHWTLTNNMGHSNLWKIEETPLGAPELPNNPDFEGYRSCFVSTYYPCSKMQKVVLKKYGLNDAVMTFLQPEILVSEWYSGRFDCGCKYELRASVYDRDDKLIEQHDYNDILLQWQANVWTKVSHSFKNQGHASYLVLHHCGVDTQFWAGSYGSKISGSIVKVMLPIKIKGGEF